VSRYLAEFEYRFNRRYDLKAIIPRLAFVARSASRRTREGRGDHLGRRADLGHEPDRSRA
jgi:hypothetical protein